MGDGEAVGVVVDGEERLALQLQQRVRHNCASRKPVMHKLQPPADASIDHNPHFLRQFDFDPRPHFVRDNSTAVTNMELQMSYILPRPVLMLLILQNSKAKAAHRAAALYDRYYTVYSLNPKKVTIGHKNFSFCE
jgi:hypothetical protein